jgi:hypothetical protein
MVGQVVFKIIHYIFDLFGGHGPLAASRGDAV